MPSAELDVPTCLDQVRAGDDDAARALVEHFYPKVIRIVRSHLPRRTLEEDLAQEVFLKMFVRLDQYEARDGKPFEHWLARLAVRTCLDALRSERRRPEWRFGDLPLLEGGERDWLDYLSAPEPGDAPTDAFAARELVEKLLSLLSADDRLILSLLDLEQRSVAEICTLTGWNASRVKVRAFRARRKLRQHLEQLEPTRP
jgi:RNA polymerase sigma-70 factor (ECF subfamily)